MVWAFHPERGGYAAKADETERTMVRGLAVDVGTMLGISISEILEQRNERAHHESEEPGLADPLADYAAELADLADLEEHLGTGAWSADLSDVPIGGHADDGKRIPMDEAIARLLPDMSEEPELARELRNITQDSVAMAKAENLATFFESLGDVDGRVWVANDDAGAWLAAANDIRLVLAARLGVVDDVTASEVYRRASEMTGHGGGDEPREVEDTEDLLAVLYSLLSWWQESLLIAIGNKARRK
ncbi:MAG: DUF2017 domain-containing protein [Ancrocorticia sp.]|jgi:hypothetical protein|nr:DUF2017 domain-containing protein [Ancrocorticia sp.]MCI1896556.1 DUF2017 domain-containing protein [Ancrocorticia sp.]MCI1964084.1 DUF2017 domain-containing protein [Ancrocorticia sp.]MCI2001768.1 DUF2017 domain-containing protein [Ancrocorticia sp.]MCI2013509.1 DUF2017 domain-containing protein [Ancrocorticia sp.]